MTNPYISSGIRDPKSLIQKKYPQPSLAKEKKTDRQENLERRNNYIPDLKQRKQQALVDALNETPVDFLTKYKERKSLRNHQKDPVAKNAQLSIEESIL